MQVRPYRSALVLVLALACGGEVATSGEAKLDEVCGESGPFRIFAVEAGAPRLVGWTEQVVDGRRILGLNYDGGEEEGRAELRSMGPCGEDPILLFEGTMYAHVSEPLGLDVLTVADREAEQIWAVDPHGVREPNVVFEALVNDRDTPHGRLGIRRYDDETFTVVLQPWPDDPWTKIVDSVPLVETILFPKTLLWGWADDVFVLNLEDELVHVSLLDHSTEVFATSVRDYEVGWDAPYVVWQHLPPDDQPDASTGTVFARHRETGDTIEITNEGRWAGIPIRAAPGRDVLLQRVGAGDASTLELYQLPSLEHVTVEGSFGLILSHIGDGRLLVRDELLSGGYSMLDTATGEIVPFFDADGPARIGSDTLTVADGIITWPEESEVKEGVLKRAWFADDRAEILAARASVSWEEIDDGRIVTPVAIDEDGVGELVVVEPQTLAEQPIDAPVFGLDRDELDGSTVVYAIADGERAGIWLAKVAALPDR